MYKPKPFPRNFQPTLKAETDKAGKRVLIFRQTPVGRKFEVGRVREVAREPYRRIDYEFYTLDAMPNQHARVLLAHVPPYLREFKGFRNVSFLNRFFRELLDHSLTIERAHRIRYNVRG